MKDGNKLSANVVLQVHKSHLHQMVDFLSHTFQDELDIIATNKCTASKTCSLVFVRARNEGSFFKRLAKFSFVFQGLNKIYVVSSNQSFMSGSIDNKDFGESLVEILQSVKNNVASIAKTVFKVETFPPKVQQRIVSILTAALDERSISENELDIAPTNHTHTLSLIQINTSIDDGKKYEKPLFLIGTSLAECIPPIHKAREPTNNDDICRAYNKLSEAFERYRTTSENKDWPLSVDAGSKRKKSTLLGVDCGAAPGGWTKYLIEQTPCTEVYSIDPGKLSEFVLSIPSVHHLQMTGEMAIPHLSEVLKARDSLISIWVSDMCVHELAQQVDMFLRAKKAGIFQSNAGFVLTIKCNIGHAKERYDELTENEVKRLKETGAKDLMVLHLFSNRMGERTVIGSME